MAPKKGGGGGSSSYGSSFIYGSSSSYWLSTTSLGGYTNAYIVAYAAFNGIFLFGLVSIAVFGVFMKSGNRHHKTVKAVMGWSRWGLAIFFGLVYYSFAFAASIIQTEGATVVNVYFIIRSILYTSLYPADIFLLLTVYTLLLHCFSMPGDDPKRNLKRNIFTAHCVFLGVLGALYLAALALGIERVVKTAGYAYAEYVYYDGTVPTVNKVDFAFTALCFVTSVEVLIATVFIAATARKRELPASLGTMLVAFVGFPLFLRWIFFLSFSAAFTITISSASLTPGGALAEQIVVGVSHLCVYAGVVFVAKRLATESSQGWAAAHGAMATAPSPQYPQQYAPPKNDPWSYHPQQAPLPQSSPLQQQSYPQYPTQQIPPQQAPHSQSPPPQQYYPQYPNQQPQPQPQQVPPHHQSSQQQHSPQYPTMQTQPQPQLQSQSQSQVRPHQLE